jgi:hypothetical protein
MNKNRLVFPKPNTSDVDTSFSSRQINSDDEKLRSKYCKIYTK